MDTQSIIDQIRADSISLNDGALDRLAEAAADAKCVLLGEASHGTSEFYTTRAELTKRLVEKHGFHFIAVEGDWPSCYGLNRHVKRSPGADSFTDVINGFNRWPTWMWANREVSDFAGWLREFNGGRTAGRHRRIGFYGIDMYSLFDSMEEIIRYLERTGSPEVERAKRAFACFDPYDRDEQQYGLSASLFADEGCEDEVVQLLKDMQEKRKRQADGDEAALDAELNALVAVNAEKYYRTMVRGGPESWNVRDRHMIEALDRVLKFYGEDAKAVVWEHNTHIGDARATDMAEDGMVNVGQLARERYGRENVFAVGFGTHRGSVIASYAWGDPFEAMDVPPARANSWEDLMHEAGEGDKMLLFRGQPPFRQTIGHRAIGVVYHPHYERGNYVPSVMADRYDAFVYIERSEALHPLPIAEPALV